MSERPRVIVHAQASVDGRVTLAPDVLLLYGDARWPSPAESGPAAAWIEATYAPQATLEGSGSFVLAGSEPDPLPPAAGDAAALYDDYLPPDVLALPDRVGWFTVVDGRGRIRWRYTGAPGNAYPGMEGWHLLVLVHRGTPPAYLAYLRTLRAPYLVCGGPDHVDLAAALDRLGAKLGVRALLSTAGGTLNGALLRAGLIDEINLEIFPGVIGGTRTPALFDSPPLGPDEHPTPLRLEAVERRDGGWVYLRYTVERG